MPQRLSALVLGIWLGAAILADIAVTQNFQTVDRFLEAPGTASASNEIAALGEARVRALLRRNAGEENNWLFTNWERAELGLTAALLLAVLFDRRASGKLAIGLSAGIVLIVAAEHFALTPRIADLGRKIDELQAGDPLVGTFWALHGFYSGLDILKIVAGLVLAVRLTAGRGEEKA